MYCIMNKHVTLPLLGDSCFARDLWFFHNNIRTFKIINLSLCCERAFHFACEVLVCILSSVLFIFTDLPVYNFTNHLCHDN